MAVLRSLLAVVAGMVFIVAASTGTDLVLSKTLAPEMASTHAPAADLALALAYRTIFGVIGGWITAKLAPSRPVAHAVVLGVIGALAALAGLVVMWGAGQPWYPIGLVVLALPECWLGGRLAARR
ncbi:hypothetical protein [Phenylobacterium sp.]|uniref:hypothetical protein n=1 Tax=Phenylobacterium sp. TaxID=1871053 RepID=UPI00374CF8E1